MKRRRKYKRLMWWRKWMKEAHRLQLEKPLFNHIADLSVVDEASMTEGGWSSFVKFTLKDGITSIFESDLFIIKPLELAAFQIYIIQTQKIIHDR